MTDLVACISDESGLLNHVKRVVEGENWNTVFLIAQKRFPVKIEKKFELIVIDEAKTISEISHELKNRLNGKIKGIEVAVNLVCGYGKAHMALMSALLKLGLAIRFIALTKEGVREV